MNKKLLITGGIFGVTGIILGAFAAHGLEKLVDEEAIVSFKTGVRYQMYHALLLLYIGNSSLITRKTKRIMWILIVLGIIMFSGSIYGLVTNMLTTYNFKEIAFLTPMGGLLLIAAWLFMLIDFIRIKGD